MSFIPGWYHIDCDQLDFEALILGYCTEMFIAGVPFLRFEYVQHRTRVVVLVRLELVNQLLETTPPGNDEQYDPDTRSLYRVIQAEHEPVPAAVPVVAEETEEQKMEQLRLVCIRCHHIQMWHTMERGGSCAGPDCYCPALLGDLCFREVEQPPVPRDSLVTFEQSLGEIRADILREATEDTKPLPPFRTCLDCGCPWMWHEAVLGKRCAGFNCECEITREQAERFFAEEVTS